MTADGGYRGGPRTEAEELEHKQRLLEAAVEDAERVSVARQRIEALETRLGSSGQATVPVEDAEASIAIPDASTENVIAERARRLALKLPAGYKALAGHFATSPETIRRRLGKLK